MLKNEENFPFLNSRNILIEKKIPPMALHTSFSVNVLLAYWEKREKGVVFSRPLYLRALRAA